MKRNEVETRWNANFNLLPSCLSDQAFSFLFFAMAYAIPTNHFFFLGGLKSAVDTRHS